MRNIEEGAPDQAYHPCHSIRSGCSPLNCHALTDSVKGVSRNRWVEKGKPMRILFFTRYIYLDGTTSHIIGLGKGLTELGHTVAVAAEDRLAHAPSALGPAVRAQFSAANIVTYEVAYAGKLGVRYAPKAFRTALKLQQLVREFRPDIIHVHWRSTSPYAALIRTLTRIPFVSTLHAETIPAGRIMRHLSFWGDRAIAISAETEDTLLTDFGVEHQRITRVLHGVDGTRFRPPSEAERGAARASYSLPADAFVVSIVARVTREKGQHLLLKALAKVRERVPCAVALIAGHGDSLTDLSELARKLGIDEAVRFVGHVDPVSAYWASDLSALPSTHEGFPYSVIESMMCAVPVIRTPGGGYRDQIIDGEDGVIIPFDDHEALAGAIIAFADDPATLKAVSDAAHAAAQAKFSLTAMAERVEAIYAGVLSSRSRCRLPAGPPQAS